MATRSKARRVDGPAADYMELVRAFPLETIRDEPHLKAAIEVVNALCDIPEAELTPGQEMYMDTLGTLIECFEDEHCPLPARPSPADALRSLMEAGEISQARLSREAGIGESTISDILSGRRRPSLKVMSKLGEYFRMDPAHFMGSDAK